MSDPGQKEDWFLHPYTKKVGKGLSDEAFVALNDLKSKCANTTDPKVAASFATWQAKVDFAMKMGTS